MLSAGIEIFESLEQGTDAWRAIRAGMPTASRFSDVLAKGEGKSRAKYLRELAAEVLTGEAAESYSNDYMLRGHEFEDEARRMFSFMRDVDPVQVGFIKNGRAGCSPDSLIGETSGLEIKVAIPAVQIERLQRGTLPSEHVAQVQGCMWVCERPTWSFVSYCPKLPPLIISVERDEAYIANLAKSVAAFNEELDALVASIRTYQDFRAQAA